MKLTGFLIGAGASYEVGMPLALELTNEIRDWLTPEKLRMLNDVWRHQGAGHPDDVIAKVAEVLSIEEMNYEHIIGYLEVQHTRDQKEESYHGLKLWLSEMIYHLLSQRHILNADLIERNLSYLEGIKDFAQTNEPLWIFSLNHDLIMECFFASTGMPYKTGFSEKSTTLPRRDSSDHVVGQLQASVLPRDLLTDHTAGFYRSGEPGVNLLKIHGSLDEFAFNDGQDLLKLSPLGVGTQGVIAALESANDDVHYSDPGWPGGIVKGTNEIIYKDNDGSMQFLRRTPLIGAFKFEKQTNQIVPNELLTRFNNNLAQLSEWVSIGYGFSDHHINQSIRSWLEQSSQRIFRMVDPAIKYTPSMFLHLSPQIEIINLQATDYLDRSAGIVRSPKQVRERRLTDWQRKHYKDKDVIFGQYMNQLRSDWMDKFVDWLKSLPWKDGEIDMEKLRLTTPEELVTLWTQSVPIQPADTVLDDFLQQVTGNHG